MYIFRRVGEYCGGALGVIAESPQGAVEVLLAYSREIAKPDYDKDGYDYFLKPDAISLEPRDRQPGKYCRDYWLLSEQVEVLPTERKRVLFFEHHNG